MRKLLMPPRGSIFIYAFLSFSIAMGQPSAGNSTPPAQPIDSATSLYHKYLGDEDPIFNGTEHLVSDANFRGFSYFQSATATKGFVLYDELPYKDMDLLYDLMTDQLVLQDKAQYLITLRTDKVGSFTLFGHQFIHTPLGPGFYDMLYSGRLTILAKRTKVIEKTIDAGEITRTVVSKDYYYALLNDKYYPLPNESRLLDLLADKKRECRLYLRTNKIKYNKDPEQAIISIAGYYNQISR
ncbi:MAG TPA: hypothetical protein VL832_08825 [Puia sp.]|jgi:hypothetical protein|nr:hypothetical protein [Puia sp.]